MASTHFRVLADPINGESFLAYMARYSFHPSNQTRASSSIISAATWVGPVRAAIGSVAATLIFPAALLTRSEPD